MFAVVSFDRYGVGAAEGLAMDVTEKPDARIEFTPESCRSLVREIVAEEETMSDLVREMGIPRESMSSSGKSRSSRTKSKA